MRRYPFSCICLVAALMALALAATADADIRLGSTVPPAESEGIACPTQAVLTQATSDAATPYVVPAGEWKLTGWEVNTADADPGAAVTLTVLRPAGGGSYDVLATDTGTLPDPLPAGGVSSFTPASPIAVGGGDLLGLYVTSFGELSCYFYQGATPPLDTIAALRTLTPPMSGQPLKTTEVSQPGYRMNLAATLRGDQDVGVTTTASPANATVGTPAILGSTVTNHGPEAGPVTFTDSVPPGLAIDSAVAGSGTCTTSGQTVDCTIKGLAAGQSAPVTIVVTPGAAGSYLNTVSVGPQAGLLDPAPLDDTAAARLDVAAAPLHPKEKGSMSPNRNPTPRACVLPSLRRLKIGAARRLLRPLGCRRGKVRHVHSRKIAKGSVIRTTPRRGTYAAGRRVGLVVSSGPPRRHHHRR